MSEENQNNTTDNVNNINPIKDEKITVNKSTYNNLIRGVVAAIAITTFVGGYTIGNFNDSDSVTTELLSEILTEIKETQSVPQPTVQPSQPSAPEIIKTMSLDDDPVKGNPNAPVTIIEFSDFQCPFCSSFFKQTLPLIEQNYIDTGKVKFVYRDYPISSIHPNAVPAALASECADEQGMFWEYHDVLFEKQNEWQSLGLDLVSDRFLAYAEELGLEETNFSSCLQSTDIEQEVLADLQDGAELGVTGTPAFFIGNEKHGYTRIIGAQPYQSFSSVIDLKLN